MAGAAFGILTPFLQWPVNACSTCLPFRLSQQTACLLPRPAGSSFPASEIPYAILHLAWFRCTRTGTAAGLQWFSAKVSLQAAPGLASCKSIPHGKNTVNENDK
ncbi:hypothetical protein NPIL_388081 [Nephila pilipes]|uniref:Secreted protein n=1 Tax=Nephila pilipes TaxID=299642 RepID=A0A8X6P9Q5_NEPPI|nr:hypothetical protein NPIL_388081 [Nephila pilipes]